MDSSVARLRPASMLIRCAWLIRAAMATWAPGSCLASLMARIALGSATLLLIEARYGRTPTSGKHRLENGVPRLSTAEPCLITWRAFMVGRARLKGADCGRITAGSGRL